LYFEILLFVIVICVPACSSLPSITGETNPVEHDGSPADTIADNETQPDETPSLVNAGDGTEAADEAVKDVEAAIEIENDFADIQKRAEEDLAYLDTPVDPDLPEPVYLFPADEAEVADAETAPEPEEPDPAALAGNTELPSGLEPEGQADSQGEIADGTIPGEDDASGPAETIVEEPPPPASLRPPREISAVSPVSPPRSSGSAIPVSLPQQPARVPPSETAQESGEKDTPPIARTIQTTVGETVEVPLPDSGWVYLGEANEQKGLSYQRRRMAADGQVFVFRPETAGSYRLLFKKQDMVRGTDTDAVIEVTVAGKPAAVSAGVAAVEKAVTTVPAGVAEKAAPLEGGSPSHLPVTAMIDEANPLIAATVDDVALWNRGRELEGPGVNRDMKGALTAYKTLVRDYPQSEYYSESQKRIAYIERFFVNIH
jgi:hypothetical protein